MFHEKKQQNKNRTEKSQKHTSHIARNSRHIRRRNIDRTRWKRREHAKNVKNMKRWNEIEWIGEKNHTTKHKNIYIFKWMFVVQKIEINKSTSINVITEKTTTNVDISSMVHLCPSHTTHQSRAERWDVKKKKSFISITLISSWVENMRRELELSWSFESLEILFC